MSSNSPITPVSGDTRVVQLQNFPVQSPLFKAALKVKQAQSDASAVVTTIPQPEGRVTNAANTQTSTPLNRVHQAEYFSYNTSDIITLLNRINPDGVTYQELNTYPGDGLSAQESHILKFLVQDPSFFNKFANLDRNGATLSSRDIITASQLAGDSLVLSSDDVGYLGQATPGVTTPVGPTTIAPAPAPANSAQSNPPVQQPQALENSINRVLQAIIEDNSAANARGSTPPTVGLPDVRSYTPEAGRLNDEDTQTLNFLRSQQTERILMAMGNPANLANSEMVKALVGMAWNPSVYLRAPVIFMGPPDNPGGIDPISAAITVQKPARAPNFDMTRSFFDSSVGLLESVRLSAHQLDDILTRINPTGEVTLKALRDYTPRNDEEKQILQCLTQHNVFQALSGMDHHDETLSHEDIKIARSHHMVVLSDAHLSLYIIP